MSTRIIAGRYHIRELLGKGGMGSVWLSHDDQVDRLVALKLLEIPESAAARNRFRREARLLARVRHPNLIEIYDYGVDGKSPFIVQELVEGKELGQLIKDRDLLDPAAGRKLAAEQAGALKALHAAGIIHRDIKPSNVMIRHDGSSVLMDFGLAKATDQTVMTKTGELVGTPYYTPAAQISGAPFDASSDVYQFGLVLHEALTGQHLHGDFDSIRSFLLTVLADDFRPREVSFDLPPDLRQIIAACCASDPSQRPHDGSALEDLVTGRQAPSRFRHTRTTPRVVPPRGVINEPDHSHRGRRILPAILVVLFTLLVTYRVSQRRHPAQPTELTALEWVQWHDRVELIVPWPKGASVDWKLYDDTEVTYRTARVESLDGTARITIDELAPAFTGRLTLLSGGQRLGTWQLNLPANDFITHPHARFGPSWLQVIWEHADNPTLELIVNAQGLDPITTTARGRDIHVEIPLDETLSRDLSWRLFRDDRLLASGEGTVGIGLRTTISQMTMIEGMNFQPLLPVSRDEHDLIVTLPPSFVAALSPIPSSGGTSLSVSWAASLTRRPTQHIFADDEELRRSSFRGMRTVLLAEAVGHGDCLILSHEDRGWLGILRHETRRRDYKHNVSSSWIDLTNSSPLGDESPIGNEAWIHLNTTVEGARALRRPDRSFILAVLHDDGGGRRVEAWRVTILPDGLNLHRGPSIDGIDDLLGAELVADRTLAIWGLAPSRRDIVIGTMHVDPLERARTMAEHMVDVRAELAGDERRVSVYSTTIGDGRTVVWSLGRDLHTFRIDETGINDQRQLSIPIDDRAELLALVPLDDNRAVAIYRTPVLAMADIPNRLTFVTLSQRDPAEGIASTLHEPDLVVQGSMGRFERNAWILHRGNLWAMTGPSLLGARPTADGFHPFVLANAREGIRADRVPLIAADGTLFVFGRRGEVMGSDVDLPAE